MRYGAESRILNTFLCLMWEEEMKPGYETRISIKTKGKGQVWDTLQCCLSLWVCSNFKHDWQKSAINWTRAQIFTKFWHHTAQTLYWQYKWCHCHVMMPMAPPGGQNWHYCIPNTSPRPQEYCVKISFSFTMWLWRYTTWQFPEGLFPSVASKHSSLITSSHGSTWPSRSNCCSDSSTHKTPSEPAINLTGDPILWLEHHRAIWWFPAVSQISGKLVHPSEYSSGNSPRSQTWCGTQLSLTGICAQFLGQHWLQENLTVGSQLAQLLRFQRRNSKLQPSWTTCPLQWIMQCHNTAESINWKMFVSDPESHQMNLFTISMLLLTDATSHQMRKRNGNIQYRLVRALNDKELIKKLLTLNLKATTPKMLKVCQTHIAISDNLEAMGLKEHKTVNAIRKQNKPGQGRKPPVDSVHSCGHCTKSHPPGWSSCPAQDDICCGCGKKGHWKPKCQSQHKGPKDKVPKYHNRGGRQKKVNEVGTDEDPHYDEVGVVTVVLQTSPHRMTNWWMQEEWSWSWYNWDIQCSDRLNNRGLCNHPDACWDWTQSTCDSQVQGWHWCRW